MTVTPTWRIPASTRYWLERVPQDRPVILLIRHSVRDDLPAGDAGDALPITEAGRRLANELGAIIGRRLQTLRSSPLVRCIQTAEALRDGATSPIAVTPDRLLGDPGVFVIDGARASTNWETLGHAGVMDHLVSAPSALPGMARPEPAARFLAHHMLATSGPVPGLHVFVTHDSLVTATVSRLLTLPLGQDAWPEFLEGAFFWREAEGIHVAYREADRAIQTEYLCRLDDTDVVEFARREIAATIGLDSGARFFLAGGAFKTLLTGRPPHDLDVWAPSAADRDALLAALVCRGARPLPARPFADAFAIADRIVEIPHAVEPSTLGERLARFDLALSAVGVEHRPGDNWSATVHPLARLSVERREVLALKPLVNWKYALTTVERARRYAAELGFDLSPDEEHAIWRVFESQPSEVQLSMIERHARTTTDGTGRVRNEALQRLRSPPAP